MLSRSLLLAGLLPLVALLYLQWSSVLSLASFSSRDATAVDRSKTPIIMASTPAFSYATASSKIKPSNVANQIQVILKSLPQLPKA